MNKKQWFVFAGVFLLMYLFFMNDAIIQASRAASEILTKGTTSFWQAMTIRSSIYGSFGTVCLGLFFIFLICGFLEPKQKK